ncbi:hypothetical protein BC834DRAFT_921410 [Gloeopeniophorella convolvens]|nr:hypothetical protein BC834DRAFT_921410 [Gloeopeniophorella convolvens]
MPTDVADYYTLLSVPRSASPTTIKAAYHRALLRHHPDKQASRAPAADADIGLLQQAFRTLTSAHLRAAYDARHTPRAPALPRPAQIVSLEEFAEGAGAWSYACRCGGVYKITEDELERGQHLVACGSCSEVVWVGYEVVEEGGGG